MNMKIKQNSSKLFYDGACGSTQASSKNKLAKVISSESDDWLRLCVTDLKNKFCSFTFSAMLAGSLFASAHVNAQEDQALEEVVVTGILGSLTRAVDIKRNADGVVDAISAEDIGTFPDTNIAESLQRISGVSIDRSGGEGQAVTVRGFGPQFNTVLINGRQIASEANTRGFNFDTLAAELVSGLEVYKTGGAALQSGGIGSTINIHTLRPLDVTGLKIAGSIKGVYEDNSENFAPQISALISNTFANDTIGVLVSITHQERDTRVDSARTDGWLEDLAVPQSEVNGGAGYDDSEPGHIFTPRNFDLRAGFEERTRTNANLVLQFQPYDSVELTLDYLYSDFDIENETTSYGHWFTGSNLEDVTLDDNGTAIDLRQEVGLATDFHAKTFDRLTETDAIGFNVDWDVNESLNFEVDYHRSTAERDANNGGEDQLSLIGYANRVRFQSDGSVLPWVSEFQEADPSIYSGQQELEGVAYDPAVTPDGVSDYLDPANLKAHVMLRRGFAVEDIVDQFRINGVWDEGYDQGLVKAKFGMLASFEEKSLVRWDNEGQGFHCTACGYPDLPVIANDFSTIFDAGSDFLGGVSGSGRTPARWVAHNGEAQFRFIEENVFSLPGQTDADGNVLPTGTPLPNVDLDAERRNNSFTVTEDTIATYLELDFAGTVASMPIYFVAGFRYEDTEVTVEGTQEPVESLIILDRTELLAQFEGSSPISEVSSYSVLLPSLSVKLDVTEDIVVRVAASQTLTRPSLQDLAPVTIIGTTRQGGNLTSSSGNPALEPFFSDNIDLSVEWYYDDASYVSLGFFHKDVDNFIVRTNEDRTFTTSDGSLLTDPSTGSDTDLADADDGVAVFTNTLPTNSESASFNGLEFAIQHTFWETGFGILFNGTLVSTDSKFNPADVTQDFAITGLSDSFNIIGFYEKGPYKIRVAYNFREEFLQDLTQVNGDGVTFVDDYQQLDLKASYDINDNFTVFFEGINLTEEVVTKHGRFSNHFLLAEDAGMRLQLGVSASF